MRDTHRLRRRRLAAVIAGVLLAAGLLLPGVSRSTAHASGPSLAVTPAANLENGQFVTLTMSGFAANGTLSFAQCTATPASVATDCTPIDQDAGAVTLSTSGAGRAFMPVYSGADPHLENQAHSGVLSCDVSHACTIAAFTTAPPSLSQAAVVPIGFSPSPDQCPPATDRAVGAGSAAVAAAMYRWESSACMAPFSLPVSYTPTNSPDGVRSFLSGSGADAFAVTGPWAPAHAPVATGSPAQTWDYAPLVNSAVVVAFVAFDRSGAPLTHLTLTPDLLAQLFTGSLSAFGTNSQVAALNPNHHLPDTARTFARSEHDSETWGFTSWLSTVAGASWVWPGGTNAGQAIGATDTWPAAGTATALTTGSDAEMTGMIGQAHSAGTGSALFALTDAGTAAFYGLPTVSIKRADGSVTNATAAAVTQALRDGTGNADGTITPNYATTDPAAWPMPMPLYALTPTNNVSPTLGTTVAKFVDYVAGVGQSALPGGYTSLNAAQVAQTALAVSAIPTSTASGTSDGGASGDGSDASSSDSSGGDSSDSSDSVDTVDTTDSIDNANTIDSIDNADSSDSSDNSDTGDSSDNSDTGDGTDTSGDGSDSGGVRSATAASALLPLGGGGFVAVAPAIAGAAGLCLLAGAGVEGANRIRRHRAKRGGAGS